MQGSVVVLLVEDEFLVRDVVEQELITAGFEVHLASDGNEAVEKLDAQGANYSTLVTDVTFPGELTGWDVARRGRQLTPTLAVVYATAKADEWPSEGVPGSVLVAKPFVPAQIVTAVTQLLNATTVSPPLS